MLKLFKPKKLQLALHSDYIEGIAGVEIYLNLKTKLSILFSKKLEICMGKPIKQNRGSLVVWDYSDIEGGLENLKEEEVTWK